MRQQNCDSLFIFCLDCPSGIRSCECLLRKDRCLDIVVTGFEKQLSVTTQLNMFLINTME
jgi:hypothetical protein